MKTEELERLADFEEWYWWHRARQTIVRRILGRYAPSRAEILDLGCGTGATSAELLAFGGVIGLDIGSAALQHARRRGLTVAQASGEQLPVRNAAVDVVVALDVLEHLDDDRGALAEIRRVLRPGGLLLATVPSYPFLWSSHDEALGHRRRYVRGELRRRIMDAGFEIRLCSYVMASILPVVIAVRLSERWRRRKPEPKSGYIMLPRLLNDWLAHIAGLDGWIAPIVRLPFGLSIIAVAQRRA